MSEAPSVGLHAAALASDWPAQFGIDALAHPSWLALLVLLALLALWRRRPDRALAWPAQDEARAAGARAIDPIRWIATALRASALFALAFALAGPVGVHRAPPEPGLGLDLVLAVDASGSMRALDAQQGDSRRTRLDLAREVVTRFAEHRAQAGDRVALVVFGETAFTQCPLTSDGALLASALSRVEAGIAGNRTAVGDALALAVKRALGAEREGAQHAGRVVVLLTDGRSNAGAISVAVATGLAAAEGVRVHTVAIGSAGDEVAVASGADAGGPRPPTHFERLDVDSPTLEGIARATGGRFFAARRSSDLFAVYAEIDALERVARRRPPRIRTVELPEPALALAGAALLFEVALAQVVRRRLP